MKGLVFKLTEYLEQVHKTDKNLEDGFNKLMQMTVSNITKNSVEIEDLEGVITTLILNPKTNKLEITSK